MRTYDDGFRAGFEHYRKENRSFIISLTKRIEALEGALKVVIEGYEGDGMELMETRDNLFYKVAKEALEGKGDDEGK
jgi:hypothetical protein